MLNLVFIFVFDKGVFGVAIATVIAQFISILVCLRKLKKIDIIQLKRSDFRRSLHMVLELLKNGVPMALMNSITSIGIMVIQYFVNGLGVAMVLIPRTLAGFMLSGEKPISLVAEFMPICGYTLIFINFLFVYRSGCQAMGHPFVPMLSGVLEMVIRVLVIIFFVSEIGFVATAWSNTVAWFGALVLNFVAFEVNLRKKMREYVG